MGQLLHLILYIYKFYIYIKLKNMFNIKIKY